MPYRIYQKTNGCRMVAVGMPVTRHPPPRSRRAALPHRAPAAGRDARALRGIRVADTRGGEPAFREAVHPLPGPPVPLTPSAERPIPGASECSGQGKTDTELRDVTQCLVVIRTAISAIRVQPHAVVKHCHVLQHVWPRFLPRRILPMGCACALETPAASFGHCVVYILACPTHATVDPVGRQSCWVGLTGILPVMS
jgi:hypothetical protein